MCTCFFGVTASETMSSGSIVCIGKWVLSLRLKRPRRNKSARARQPTVPATRLNEIWSIDFLADALFAGRKLRALAVVDNYSRECLAIEVGLKWSRIFPLMAGTETDTGSLECQDLYTG